MVLKLWTFNCIFREKIYLANFTRISACALITSNVMTEAPALKKTPPKLVIDGLIGCH